MDLDKFGKRLRSLIDERGMTQADLASSSKIAPQSISKYIKGLSLPDLDTIVKISQTLGVSIDSLVENDLSPISPPQAHSTRCLLRAFVIAADELNLDVSHRDSETLVKHDCMKTYDDINAEATDLSIEGFFSSWVKYKNLLKSDDITKEEYDALLQSRLDRDFPT